LAVDQAVWRGLVVDFPEYTIHFSEDILTKQVFSAQES